MKREIKFRAWDGKKILYDVIPISEKNVLIGFIQNGLDINLPQGRQISVILHYDEVDIMQYTGRKDKNGEEIYEGDVLKNKYNQVSDVRYNESIAAFYWEHGENWGMIEPEFDEIEIIGNIYENPELLT